MPAVPIEWYTTSPWLFESLKVRGQKVHSLETRVTPAEINDLGTLASEMSRIISEAADQFLGDFIPKGVSAGSALQGSLQRTIFVLAYKAFLSREWMGALENGTRIIVGKGRLQDVEAFQVGIGRFDNVFAALAAVTERGKFKGCEIMPFEASPGGEDPMVKMMSVGQSLGERLLLLVNLPLSSLAYKLIMKMPALRDLVRFIRGEQNRVYLLRPCELLEETIPYLMLKKARISYLPVPWLHQKLPSTELDFDAKTFKQGVFPRCRRLFESRGVPFDPFQQAAAEIILHRTYQAIKFLPALLEKLRGSLAALPGKKEGRGRKGVAILTNGLTSPAERLLYQSCRLMKIPVFAFDHGVTAGLSHLSAFQSRNHGIKESDRVICFSPAAFEDYLGQGAGKDHGIVSGAPKLLTRLKGRFAQSLASRMMFNIPLSGRVVMYVSMTTQNNMIYGPYGQSDLAYYQITRTVISDVLGKIEDPCVVKLYPSARYPDPDPFSQLSAAPPNVTFIQFFEFRYLRSMADVIIVDSPQSTLGWVWSSGIPVIFLNLPWNPLLPEVEKEFSASVFQINCSKEGWAENIRALLQLSHDELLRLWGLKSPAREKVKEQYIFGPPGNAGKRAAEYIASEIEEWYSLAGEKRRETARGRFEEMIS